MRIQGNVMNATGMTKRQTRINMIDMTVVNLTLSELRKLFIKIIIGYNSYW